MTPGNRHRLSGRSRLRDRAPPDHRCGRAFSSLAPPQKRRGGEIDLLVPVVLGDELDAADDVGVEAGQVLGRDPVLDDGAPADLVGVVVVEEAPADVEAGDVAAAWRERLTSLRLPPGAGRVGPVGCPIACERA
jgi:hypothetical protein